MLSSQDDYKSSPIQQSYHTQAKQEVFKSLHFTYSIYIIAMALIAMSEFTSASYEQIYYKIGLPFSVGLLFSALKLALTKYPRSICANAIFGKFFIAIAVTEKQILESPHSFQATSDILFVIAITQSVTITLILKNQDFKYISNIIVWMYYLSRNLAHYSHLPLNHVIPIVVLMILNKRSAQIFLNQLENAYSLYTRNFKLVQKNLKETLQIIPQGVFILEISDYEISFANQELFKILGIFNRNQIKEALMEWELYEKDIQTQDLYDLKVQKDQTHSLFESSTKQSDTINLLEFLILKHNTLIIQDYVFRRKNPKKFFQVKSSLVNNETQLLVVINDITRFKELEIQSIQARALFFQSIANELRTPLNAIIPMATKLEDQEHEPAKKNYLSVILNSALYLHHVIEDALDMSRFENKTFSLYSNTFNVKEAINDVCSIMEFQIKSREVRLIVDVSKNVPDEIQTDEKRYKQILFNLISNASKFTFKGFIKVRVDYREDKYLITEIEDSGIGMKEQEIQSLFKFFGKLSSQKMNNGGMGLGLTISKMIIQQLSGKISVESQYQKGSKFTFSILIETPCKDLSSRKNMKRSINYAQRLYANEFTDLRDSSEFDVDSPLTELLKHNTQRDSNDELHNVKTFQFLDHIHTNSDRVFNHTTHSNAINHPPPEIKVLVVDDSAYNLFIMEELLNSINPDIQIHAAANGQEAIEIILSNKSSSADQQCTFKYVFLDIHMPILDGFQTIKQLRSMEKNGEVNLEQTTIIGLSAITLHQFQSEVDSLYFDDFMEKPVNYDNLAAIFNQ